jgi:hypothetical protein
MIMGIPDELCEAMNKVLRDVVAYVHVSRGSMDCLKQFQVQKSISHVTLIYIRYSVLDLLIDNADRSCASI